MADEELTPAEKLKLAQNFILNSPPGQTQKVVEDCRTLIGPTLDDASLARMVAKVNRDQFLSVQLPNSDTKVLLTPAGQLQSGNFLDPSGKQQLKIDHLQQRCVGVAPLSGEEMDLYASAASESARKKVESAMRRYAADSLPGATVTTYGKADGEGIKVTCCIGGCNMNLGSYWSGLWRSEWTVKLDNGSAQQGELTGQVKCHVHYFEDGNVQLNDSTVFKKSLVWEDDVGTAFVKQVKSFEEKFMESMEDIYQTMSDQVLNALRRRLPITKVKFDWERASVHKLAAELNAFKAS